MPFKLTTRHSITFVIAEGEGDTQIELYRSLLRMAGDPDPTTFGIKVISNKHAFVDIRDVERHLLDKFGVTIDFQPITEYPDQQFDELHTASGDPLHVRLQRVTTTELRGPWLSAKQRHTLDEFVDGWNTWNDHPGHGSTI